MAWLVNSEARVLASAEVAADRRSRRRGLIGRDDVPGAFVLPRCRWVHTIGVRFSIDVAYVSHEGRVIKTTTMKPFRIGWPVRGATCVIEADAGAFDRWPLTTDDVVEVRDSQVTEGLPMPTVERI